MIGLDQTVSQFFIFYLGYLLIGLCGNSLGYFIGSMTSDTKLIPVLIPVILMPFILFSGLYKNRDSYPEWLGWLEYTSPIKYGYIILLANEVVEEDQQVLLDRLNFDVSL